MDFIGIKLLCIQEIPVFTYMIEDHLTNKSRTYRTIRLCIN